MNPKKRKPSVTKAFKEFIFPLMKEDGFLQLNAKKYARIVDSDVLQTIILHVDSRLRRSYSIEYCSLIMSEPHEFLSLEIGGKFEKLSAGKSYGAVTEDMLEKTIHRAAIAYKEDALPKLQKQASLEGIKNSYLLLRKNENYDNPNTLFSIACSYAALNDEKNAFDYAIETYELCKSMEPTEPNTEWVSTKIDLSDRLINALKSENYNNLLREWRDFTISSLKLDKLL